MSDLSSTKLAASAPFNPPSLSPSRAIIYLRYARGSNKRLEAPDDTILVEAIRQLENNAAHIAGAVVESFAGEILPNPWNQSFIAGLYGSPLPYTISHRAETVGLGEDRYGQLLVSAAMSGVIALFPPKRTENSGRLAFLGHDIKDLRHSWIKSLSSDSDVLASYEADAEFDPHSPISNIVPRVRIAKGRFWDHTHFDVRTNFALALREFTKAGIALDPQEDVITPICRTAASLIRQMSSNPEAQSLFQEVRMDFQLPFSDDIVLLPTCSTPALSTDKYSFIPGRFDEDPLEFAMPAILSSCVGVSVPCGYSAEGLPVGLMMAGPVHLSARLLALADWFVQATGWQTVPQQLQ